MKKHPTVKRKKEEEDAIRRRVNAAFAEDVRQIEMHMIRRLSPNAYWLLRFLMNVPEGFNPTQEKILNILCSDDGLPKLRKGTLQRMTAELRNAGILTYAPRFVPKRKGMVGLDWVITLPQLRRPHIVGS